MTKTRRPRGGIGMTMRGNKFEATYNIPKAQLAEGQKRHRITAHGDSEQAATIALLAKLQAEHVNPPLPATLTATQEAETTAVLGADGRDVTGEKKAKYAGDAGPLLSDWAEEWLTDWTSGIQESTHQIYAGHVRTYILPYLGHYHLNEITARKLKTEWWEPIGKLRKVRAGVETDEPLLGDFAISNVYKTLRKVLSTAHHKLGTRVSLTEKLIKKPEGKRPETDREIQAITKRLTKQFITEPDKDDPRWSHFILQLLVLRQSERLGISVSDINLDDPEDEFVSIAHQLSYLKSKKWYLKDITKNGEPREVPLFGIFTEAMQIQLERRAHWAKQPGWNPDPKFADLLFLKEDGQIWAKKEDNKLWHEFAGDDLRGHVTRHVTGHLLAELGITLEVAKVILGHKSDAYATYYRAVSNMHARAQMRRGFENLAAPRPVAQLRRRA